MTLKRTTPLKRTGFRQPARRADPAGAPRVNRGDEAKRYSTLNSGTKALSRGKGLRQVSEARQAENDPEDGEWTLLRAERFAIDTDPETGLVVCQAAGLLPGRCWGGMTVHHLDRTGLGYPRICPVERLRSVCVGHHVESSPNGIHADLDRARALGLLGE